MRRSWSVFSAVAFFLMALSCGRSSAQGVATPGDACKPASERSQELGCWIKADDPVGQFSKSDVFWHLDTYSTRAAAEADKGPRAAVIESFGKVWLMTIGDQEWRSAHGNHVDEIGPIPVMKGENYSEQLMEVVFNPGMTAAEHVHSGSEAFYMLTGEACLETSDGRVQVGRPGEAGLIIPAGIAMHLTAIGTEQRHSLVLILHQSSKPATTMVHDWTAKGLCKNEK
jgi:quercetin dioxygenase-like cupin family protein